MNNARGIRRIIAIAMTVAIGTVLIEAAPAHASTSQGFVAGAGSVTDDFGDEGVTDYNTNKYSRATGLWQAILWADGAIESDGTRFDFGDIDCDFGPNTKAATKSWQGTHNLSTDGSAGPLTWGASDANLKLGAAFSNGNYVDYVGKYHTVQLWRADSSSGYRYENIDWWGPGSVTGEPSAVITYGNSNSCYNF